MTPNPTEGPARLFCWGCQNWRPLATVDENGLCDWCAHYEPPDMDEPEDIKGGDSE